MSEVALSRVIHDFVNIAKQAYKCLESAIRQFSAALEPVCVLTAQRNVGRIDKRASLTIPAARMTFNMVIV
jgi:hypothetical protein